jgi:hypothetical protein
MELKQKFICHDTVWSAEEMNEKDMENFSLALEELMNRYKIYRVDAHLNPYSKGVQMILSNDKRMDKDGGGDPQRQKGTRNHA